jgi:hypothetical protein
MIGFDVRHPLPSPRPLRLSAVSELTINAAFDRLGARSWLRPPHLSQKLDRPLPTKDGGTLRTIGEACDYMTAMDKKREMRPHWQWACKAHSCQS